MQAPAPRGAARRHRRRGAGARPGIVVALLEPRVRAARRGRRPRARRHLGGGAAGERSSTRSGSRARPRSAADPAARGYFVEPYSDAVQLEPDPDLGGAGALGKLWSTTGDLARWGAFLAAGDDRVLKASTLEEMAHVRAMVDHERLDARVGHRPRALPLRRPRLRRPRRRHAGPPRGSRGQPQDQDRRGGAHEHGRRRLAGEACARPRGRGDRGAAGGGGGVAAGGAAPPEIEPLLGRWWIEGSEIVVLVAERPARGEARRRPSRARHLDLRARRRRPLPQSSRAASAASCCASCGTSDGSVEKLYFATYPLTPRAFDVLALAGDEERRPRCPT